MPSPATTRIAAVAPEFVERAPQPARADWLSYFDPDVVLLTGDSPATQAVRILRRETETETVCFHPSGTHRQGVEGAKTVDGVQFVFAPSTDALRAVAGKEGDELRSEQPTYVLSNLLDVDVDTTTLSTSLVGGDQYRDALAPERLDGEYVHVSTRLPKEYRREWNDLTVVGGGADAGTRGEPLVALDCRSDGELLTRTLTRDQLGLRALDGVGRTRAQRLRDAGFQRRDAVADAEQRHLRGIQGLGETTAERIQQSARALADGEVVRSSDEQLPNGDPVYVDIETDGLAPTITWLIGVLDGSAEDGTYISFVQRNPDEPGRALEDFLAWYAANASHRPVVAYNGWRFDFPVIHDHVIEYCPRYEDDWTSTYRFDPYQWAVTNGNAVLPGRTNKLGDVAEALGHEPAETGLTGAAVARAYQAWMADRSPETEPDWEQLVAYCEDDVRALATIHEALQESSRIVSTTEQSRDLEETTTQGSLSDW
ncbi:ribonuclease H-like domain-containing protein [Halobacterium zhouii]|uniref:ribonuclease H-like domain-containing protein n=1 Tax=Halobacterium zhouii TaxID=2902624 RepID=UPI001E2E11E6|nr:ribonuclease H-like domain-containing protein [Halobacterium zhouii]